ncbi:MAG: glycoside hydrolase family 19 protein [Bacteroidota bacterium]
MQIAKIIAVTVLGVLGYSVVKANTNKPTQPTIDPPPPTVPTANELSLDRAFKNAIVQRFGNLSSIQKDSLEEIFGAWEIYGDGDRNKLAYIIATAYWESKMQPIKERRARAGTKLYDIQNRYWLTGYYGRGFVQLTWERNYEKMSKFLGVDLVNNTDLALNPRYAARILVYGMMNGSFTRKKLSDYINSGKQDFFNARKTVNGTDKAAIIEGYTVDILNNLRFTA